MAFIALNTMGKKFALLCLCIIAPKTCRKMVTDLPVVVYVVRWPLSQKVQVKFTKMNCGKLNRETNYYEQSSGNV